MTFNRSRATRLIVIAATLALTVGAVGAPAVVQADSHEAPPSVGLITKTEINPFFVTMRNAASAKAEELGVPFQACAGTSDVDVPGQTTCIENMVANGVNWILLTPGDPIGMVGPVQAAQEQGVTFIALDTQMNPTETADATLATDNYQAGLFIGQWAAAQVGDAAGDAVIALLDVSDGLQITTEVQRNNGFLEGFGVDVVDNTIIGDETDPRIAGWAATDGNQDLGRTAMENLLAATPDINLVYTINEPAAAGAYEAIEAAGRAGEVLIVSVDGGCAGIQDVVDGKIGATSMQFPLRMAVEGVEAAASGELPVPSEGLPFKNTGVVLVTDQPVDGIDSQDTAWGLDNCWG